MRHLLILTGLLFVTGATADEADFDFKSKKANIAIEKYEATIKNAKAVEKRNRVDLILALEAALKYERTEGELDEAIKIRDAIKALKKGVTSGRNSVDRGLNQNEDLLPDGIYRADFGNFPCTLEFRKKGHILTWIGQVCESGRFEPTSVRGVIKQVGNNVFEITFDGGQWFARWWVYDQHIIVEWWDYHHPEQQKNLKQPWHIAVIDRSKKR